VRRLIFLIALACLPAKAATIYFAPTSAGSNNGTSCANAYAWTDGTHGVNTTASQVPGNTLVMCDGTYTGSAGGSGIIINPSTSGGSPITFQLYSGGSGATLQAPYWGNDPINVGTAAGIYCTPHNNTIVIDGGGVAVIKNTANGSPGLGYANQQGSAGMVFNGCPNVEVKNLTVTNIYVHQAGSSDTAGTNTTQCISMGSGGTLSASGSSVHGNTLNNCWVGMGIGYDSGSGQNLTSIAIYNNNINVNCHSIVIATGSNNASASNVSFYGNTLGPDYNTWVDSGQGCHQDGIFPQASLPSDSISNLYIYNNDISASTCPAAGGNFTGYMNITALNGSMTNIQIFNNVLHNTGGSSASACQLQGFITLGGGSSIISTVLIANNVFDLNGLVDTSGATNSFLIESGKISGQTVKNNVIEGFTNSGNGTYRLTSNVNTFAQAFTGIDYNLYYLFAKMAHDDINGQDLTSFNPDWQDAHATNAFPGYDGHGLNTAPGLNSSYVPTSSGSAVVGAGTNLCSLGITALNSDKSGATRPCPSGAWSIGAFNYPSPQVATPLITPGNSTQSTSVTVTITDSTVGATLCYTTDGSTPTANGAGTCTHGTTYSGAFSSGTPPKTIQAIGSISGSADSGVTSAVYTLPVVVSPCSKCLVQAPEPPTNLRVVAVN